MASLASGEVIFNKDLVEPQVRNLLAKVSGFLRNYHLRGFLVGGFIRDMLLGLDTSDIDIAIQGDSLNIAKLLSESLEGRFVLLDETNKIARIVLKDIPCHLDVGSFQSTIEDDLARRDFTIDAMAVSLEDLTANSSATVIDPFHGIDDLDHAIIRTVRPAAFPSDPIRLLRAVRLSYELGFDIDLKTESEIRHSAILLGNVAGERVREELLRLLESARGGSFLFYMDDLGLLTAIFPELLASKDVIQPVEHHWDVFTHSIMTVTTLDFILGQSMWEYPPEGILTEVPWSSELADYFEQPVASGSTRRTLLKLAALLHDVAKPQTKALDEKGRIRFLGHQEQGAEIVTAAMERLRFSTREANLVANVVKYHLRPTQMGDPPSKRAIYRYFRDTGDAGKDILFLSLADHLATRGPGLIIKGWVEHTEAVRTILEEQNRQEKIVKPHRLIDGNDLIYVFGMRPGPEIGKILGTVNEAQAAGELTTRETALDYIRNVILEGKK